jgi:TetR/AcrR family transcriptional regulator, regulator of autoinduction and epiphytic fitness
MVQPANVTRLDGRIARSQRTRAAIVEALLELLESGNVQPTVEEIAARAGVAPRTVFQHYQDREALFAAVTARQVERITPLMTRIEAEGSLDERLDALVAQRMAVYELIAPVRRAALLMEPFSEHTHGAIESFRELKRRDVVRIFQPELDAVPAARRPLLEAALGASASWSAWDALRTQQRLPPEQAAAVLRGTLRALLTAA